MRTSYVLYGRQDCHLCDQAAQLLEQIDPVPAFHKVDIDDDPTLLDRYATRIPVLRSCSSAAELGWPFTARTLQRWLASQA